MNPKEEFEQGVKHVIESAKSTYSGELPTTEVFLPSLDKKRVVTHNGNTFPQNMGVEEKEKAMPSRAINESIFAEESLLQEIAERLEENSSEVYEVDIYTRIEKTRKATKFMKLLKTLRENIV